MNVQLFGDNLAPAEALNMLINRHGVLRVLLALPRAMLQRRGGALLLQRPISYHIARDIGLSYDPPRKDPWQYR